MKQILKVSVGITSILFLAVIWSWSFGWAAETPASGPLAETITVPKNDPVDVQGNSPVASGSGNSIGATSTVVNSRLMPPTGVEARSGGDRVLIAWEPAPPAGNNKLSYQLFRAESPLSGYWDKTWPAPLNPSPLRVEYFLDMPGFSSSPPEKGKTYYYSLISVDGQGNSSAASAPLKVLNIPMLCEPGAVEATAGNQSVHLKWLPSFSGGEFGLCGYMIFRSTEKGQLGSPLFTEPIKTEDYTDRGDNQQGLVNGKTYYYTFFSEDNAGNRSQVPVVVKATPFAPPTSPLQINATPKSDDMITLTWSPSTAGSYGLKGYQIYRKSDKETEFGAPINKTLVIGTTFVDSEENSISKPILGREYTYVVRAVDTQDHESPPSEGAVASPLTPIAIPKQGILSTAIPGLPPDSSLTISGRKKIDIGYTDIISLSESENANPVPSLGSGLTDGFNLEQELQVRLEGKVGKKITVDVDYDDTQEEQRKISIQYAGDPDEVVQEAAFGDINLDLDKTEFAGYNKNLFGAKVKVGYNGFNLTAIGAQTKGITVTESFQGNTSPKKIDIADTSFVAYKYYYLTKDWPNQVNHYDLPIYASKQAFYSDSNPNQKIHGIVPQSVEIWVRDGLNDTNSRAASNTTTANIFFNRFSPGIDYTVDYQVGVINFTRPITRTWSIAVAYRYRDANDVEHSVGYDPNGQINLDYATLQVPVDGKTSDSAHLIQDYNTNDPNLSKNYIMMLMQRYNLGYQNIVDPQSDREFVIKIYKSNGEEYPLPLPTDTLNAEKIYSIDPTFGTISFRHDYPFTANTLQDPSLRYKSDIYNNGLEDAYSSVYNTTLGGSNNSIANNISIHVEFKNTISTFNLSHWNVIKDSEVIRKDGLKMQRNTDYFIDYDTGFITFLNPDSIASSSDISITYEYLPFGGKYQTNLFGARAEYDIIDKRLTIGSTFLYNASQTPMDIPDVNSAPTSLAIYDGDVQLNLNPKDFSDMLNPLVGETKIPLSLNVSAEGAYSHYELNTYRKSGEDGVAMVDNMEGSDNILSLPVGANANNIWSPSSLPSTGNYPDPIDRDYIRQSVVYEYGRTPVDSNDKKHQLRWAYNGLNSNRWDGFVYPLNSAGSNLHEYRFLEMVIYSSAAAANTVKLNVDLGLVSEDANNNGKLNFEGDRQKKLEGYDVGPINTIVGYDPLTNQPIIGPDQTAGVRGEGIYPQGAPTGYWGDGNGQLDNEDMDNNDQLDTVESYYEYSINLQPGWNIYKIPLSGFTTTSGAVNINPQDQTFMSFVKHVRMWMTGQTSADQSGYVQFESISLTGNKWQPMVAPGAVDALGNSISAVPSNKINATAISLETDSHYVPNTFFYIIDELQNEQQQLLNEKSLKLEYDLTSQDVTDPADSQCNTPAYYFTRTLTTASQGYDYSRYRYLRLDIYKQTQTAAGEYVFVRLGIDDNNYYEYRVPLDQVQPMSAWHTVTLELDGRDGERREVFGENILRGLNNIKTISMGVYNPNATAALESIWINNLRVTGARSKQGMAYRISTSTKWGDVFTIRTDHRDVDSDFFTIDETPVGKQRQVSELVAGTMTKFSFMPVDVSWSRNESYTEQDNRDDFSYSNNFSTPDLTTETFAGNLGYSQIPGLDISVHTNRSRSVREYIVQRTQPNSIEETSSVNPQVSYSLPDRLFNVPIGTTTISGKVTYTDTHTMYNQADVDSLDNSTTASDAYYSRWQHSLEESYTYSGNYSPIRFVRLTPQFTYSRTRNRGFLSLYRYYYRDNYDLNSQGRYYSDDYRDAHLNKIAKLNVNISSIPVFSPSLSYTMTNDRDYIQDSLSTPGTLSIQSGINLGDILGWNAFPQLNFTETYSRSATFKYEQDNQTIDQLDFQDMWLINFVNFQDDNEKLNNAYINSRKKTDSLTANINFIPNVTLSPQYSTSWTKNMNTRDNYITTETESLGGTFNWTKVPSFDWLAFQTLNLDYRYDLNQQLNAKNIISTKNTTHTTTLTIPFRLTSDLGGTLTGKLINERQASGDALNKELLENEYNAGISFNYNLNMVDPIRLPNFWPFNGALMKLEQTLRLTNYFNIKFTNNQEYFNHKLLETSLYKKDITEYSNDTTINYSLWRNVEGDIKLTNQWYFDKVEPSHNYYAISLKAGITAIF